MSGFFKFTQIGQAVAGRITRFAQGDSDKGPFIALSPVMVSNERGAVMQQWESCAVGLSTDLALKISERDVGSLVTITFKDKEPTTKGSPRKIFTVMELSVDEMRELAATTDKSHRSEPYPNRADEKTPAANNTAGADDDDLPF